MKEDEYEESERDARLIGGLPYRPRGRDYYNYRDARQTRTRPQVFLFLNSA